nr:exportin-4 isoform X3 [Ipomoea batatas]
MALVSSLSSVTMFLVTLINAPPPLSFLSDSWRELANAFANERTLFSLYASYQRSLAQTLVLSATGMRDSEMSYQYVKYLTSHMTAYLVELSGRNDLKKVAEQPDIILLISLSISKTLRSEEDTERYKDIRVLLQLLASLCSKDLIDFSSEPIEAHGTNISQKGSTKGSGNPEAISDPGIRYPSRRVAESPLQG